MIGGGVRVQGGTDGIAAPVRYTGDNQAIGLDDRCDRLTIGYVFSNERPHLHDAR